MEGSHWLNNNRVNRSSSNHNSDCESPAPNNNINANNEDEVNENSAESMASNVLEAMKNHNSSNETPFGTISEKHVYKYRCAQCSLAFKTAEKLALHSQYHVIRDSTKCRFCSRSFRSVQALLKHVEASHNEVPNEELAHYKLGLMNHPLLMAGLTGQVLDPATNDLLRKESANLLNQSGNEADMDTSNEDNNPGNEALLPLEAAMGASKKSLLLSTFSRTGSKSEKGLNYPLEKYLDPNRPYKCDVCKESFTQKNILLVHYNSVSHLHRLKKTMQDQQLKENNNGDGGIIGTPVGKSSPSRGGSLESALSNLANAKQMRLEDEAADKPYKCNICKVSYNQGSTLDIHIRSVLHQTRASKLQDLALTGQIDFSKPLIEQPDSRQLQEQHKKILQDMLSPKSSFNSSNSSNPSPTASPTNSLFNLQQILLNAKQQQQQQQQQEQQQQEEQQQQQQQKENEEQQKVLQQFLQQLNNNSENQVLIPNEEAFKNFLAESGRAKSDSPQAVKNLLENYGFELVMQFNEFHQRKTEAEERRRKELEANNAVEETAASSKTEANSESGNENSFLNNSSNETASKSKEQQNNESNNEFEKASAILPEDSAANSEKVEEQTEEQSRENQPPLSPSSSSTASPIKKPLQIPVTSSALLTPEKSSEDERSNFPETSTPKSRSSTPQGGQSGTNALEASEIKPKELNLADFSSNFQKAMLNAQQQSQGINPMLLQMAQFQGMNPLVAMNLHPPLIPPSILAAQQGSNQPQQSQPNSPVGLNQNGVHGGLLKPPNDENSAQQQQLQLMMKLGIDPKILAQSGLDPKFLLNMGNAGPPKLPDLNLLALLTGQQQQPPQIPQQQQPNPENLPDPKLLFQMMQMGMPGQAPDPALLLQLAQMGKDPVPGAGIPGLPGFDTRGPQPLPMGQKPMFPQPEQTKRARTRITDDQLKVLRSNFDINNSPSEEQIMTMAGQTGLPTKVIKHWFRNTLFKERQKNKDSPYNFNNPPSTMLNLEEYERTGEPKVIPLNIEEQKQYTDEQQSVAASIAASTTPLPASTVASNASGGPPTPQEDDKKDEGPENLSEDSPKTSELRVKTNDELIASIAASAASIAASTAAASVNSTDSIASSPIIETSLASSLTLSSILSSQMAQLPKPGSFLPHPLVPNFPPSPNSMGGRLPEFLNPLANMMANEQPQRQRSPTPQPPGSANHQGKRANRTRFTDYQIKVLQEFFENNAYPKDDDLEYLSKLLSLSPRVIVVWFQNARQKARKIYENQPPLDPNDDGAGRFTRTPGLNYQCKKCLLVFQRYYELIRHQKQHCFKEEDAKRSAQAQKAAAQAAAQFNNQQMGGSPSGSGYPPPHTPGALGGLSSHHSDDSNSSTSHDRTIQSPMFSLNFQDKRRSLDGSDEWSDGPLGSTPLPLPPGLPLPQALEEKKMTPSMFDQLTRGPMGAQEPIPSCSPASSPATVPSGLQGLGLFPKLTANSTLFPSYPPSSPFGILQQQALQSTQRDRDSDDFDTESVGSSPSSGTKRKHSEDGIVDLGDEKDESGQPRDKRLRTTILPEQLDYLYQKYQIESNPSRKMLEQIANEVGLRKRVVQVSYKK